MYTTVRTKAIRPLKSVYACTQSFFSALRSRRPGFKLMCLGREVDTGGGAVGGRLLDERHDGVDAAHGGGGAVQEGGVGALRLCIAGNGAESVLHADHELL